MSGRRCACSMGEAACPLWRARADPETPCIRAARSLLRWSRDDRSRVFRPLRDASLFGEFLPECQGSGELEKSGEVLATVFVADCHSAVAVEPGQGSFGSSTGTGPGVGAVDAAWNADGTWARIHDILRVRLRAEDGRDPQPLAAVLDSQSVHSSEGGEQIGYGARTRHLLVDTFSIDLGRAGALGVGAGPGRGPARAGRGSDPVPRVGAGVGRRRVRQHGRCGPGRLGGPHRESRGHGGTAQRRRERYPRMLDVKQ